eukprot:GHVN01056913.1.p1 GENE.GHVN01056913.1~~GHVN01056913.1.p1  ORF type:complete len:680 (-),score=50.32 GHVN01056913.1:1158-3197(-)
MNGIVMQVRSRKLLEPTSDLRGTLENGCEDTDEDLEEAPLVLSSFLPSCDSDEEELLLSDLDVDSLSAASTLSTAFSQLDLRSPLQRFHKKPLLDPSLNLSRLRVHFTQPLLSFISYMSRQEQNEFSPLSGGWRGSSEPRSSDSSNETLHVNRHDKQLTARTQMSWLTQLSGKSVPEARHQNLVHLVMAAFAQGSSETVFPATFASVQDDLGVSPTALGTCVSAQRLGHTLMCPIWGILLDNMRQPMRDDIVTPRRLKTIPRTTVMPAAFCCLWGIIFMLMTFARTGLHLCIMLGLSGMLVSVMPPLSQKLTAEGSTPSTRGRWFGWLFFFQGCGRIVAQMVGTNLSGGVEIGGYSGWRLAMFVAGVTNIVVGVLTYCVVLCITASENRKTMEGAEIDDDGESDDAMEKLVIPEDLEAITPRPNSAGPPSWCTCRDIFAVITNKSLVVMIFQGIFNGIPRSALSFSTLFFQYCGVDNLRSSIILSSSWAAAVAVSPLVGLIADGFHKLSPNHGRTYMAQCSVVIRIIAMTLMLTVVPQKPESFIIFLGFAIVIGLLAGWPGVGANRPLLAEVSRMEHRAGVYALVCSAESAGGALLGAPFVGIFAERMFGYVTHDSENIAVEMLGDETRSANAYALSRAMLLTTVLPWIITLLCYGVLHFTLKHDRTKRELAKTRRADK